MNQIIQSDYCSWMLRLRRSSPHDRWHVSLQSTTTGEVLYFAGLDALLAFLGTVTAGEEICPQEPP
jgi:hypothetical protein